MSDQDRYQSFLLACRLVNFLGALIVWLFDDGYLLMPKAIGGGAAKVRNNHHAVKRCDHRDIDPAQSIVAVDYGRRREAGGTIDGSLDEQRKTKIQVSVICSQDDFVGVRRENREKVDFIFVSGLAQIGRGFDVETGHHHVADKEQRAEPERGFPKDRLRDHAHIYRRGGRKCDFIGISEVRARVPIGDAAFSGRCTFGNCCPESHNLAIFPKGFELAADAGQYDNACLRRQKTPKSKSN